MYVAINHTITDTTKWSQDVQKIMGMVEQGQLPEGMKPVMFLPGVDSRKAVCLWEGGSLEEVRSFLDRATGEGAKNEYIAVNAEAAIGLPAQEVAQKTD